jgi:xanthine dehydrogenase small subunit
LDATLTLARWQPQSHSVAQRALALSAFFLGYRQTALQAGELIAAIHIPRSASPATTVHAHTTGQWMRAYKVSKRFEDDISAVCLALWLDVVDGVVRQARIGLGGVAATPLRGLAAEQVLQGQAWTHASAEAAARALQSQCAPLSDMRASSAYRNHLLLALMQRAFEDSQGLGPSSVFVDSIGPVEVTP